MSTVGFNKCCYAGHRVEAFRSGSLRLIEFRINDFYASMMLDGIWPVWKQFCSRVKQLINRVNQQFKNSPPLGYALAMKMVYLFGALVMTVLTDVEIDANI